MKWRIRGSIAIVSIVLAGGCIETIHDGAVMLDLRIIARDVDGNPLDGVKVTLVNRASVNGTVRGLPRTPVCKTNREGYCAERMVHAFAYGSSGWDSSSKGNPVLEALALEYEKDGYSKAVLQIPRLTKEQVAGIAPVNQTAVLRIGT